MVNLILENICHSSLISFKIMQPRAANCHQCSFMIYNENVLVVVTILGSKNQKRKVDYHPTLTTLWKEQNPWAWCSHRPNEGGKRKSYQSFSPQQILEKMAPKIFSFYFRQVSVTVSAEHLGNDLSDWLSRSLLPLATLCPTMPIEILLSCVAEICCGESYESKSVLIELLARIIHLIAQ